MKSKLLLALAIFWSSITFAQFETPRDISIDVGQPYKVVDAPTKLYFYSGNEVMSIKIVKNKAVVQKFDTKAMRQKSIRELPLPKGSSIESIREFGGKYLIFYSVYDKGRTSEQLFYREVDFRKGGWKGGQVRLIATDRKLAGSMKGATTVAGGMFSFYNFGVTDKFDIYTSSDSSKLMVQYRKTPKEKSDAKNYDEIGLYVYDEDMEEIWGGEETMPYTEKEMNNTDYAVDKEGNIYILAQIYEDGTTRSTKKGNKDQPNYHFELLKKSQGQRDFSISKIEIDNKFISYIKLFETPENKLVCAGYYNKNPRNYNAEGIFYVKVDKDGEIYESRSYEIPLALLNQYESKRSRKKNAKKEDKGEASMPNLKLRKVSFQNDGSIILIGEQYIAVTSTTRTAGGGTSSSTTYYYSDMLITKIESDGELAWMRKLPKNQSGKRGMGGMSYKYAFVNNKHYIFYIDNAKNMQLPFDQAPAGHVDGTFGFLTAYILDDERGEVTKESILDMKNVKGTKLYQFAPSRIVALANDEFLFESYKKKKEDVMVKISIKE